MKREINFYREKRGRKWVDDIVKSLRMLGYTDKEILKKLKELDKKRKSH